MIAGRLLRVCGDVRAKGLEAASELAAAPVKGRLVGGRRFELNEVLDETFDPCAMRLGGGQERTHWLRATGSRLRTPVTGYNGDMIRLVAAALATLGVLAAVGPDLSRADQATPPASQRPQPPRPAAAAQPLFPEEAAPTEQLLGVAVYPGAVFLTSYEAGKGQRFYLYGSAAGYTELIAYYRTLLKQRGTAVFESPATHIFEVGKYDENAMAFPPSVTIKDYASGGNGGYLNPKPGPSPQRFPTVIQIVPIQATN